MAEKESRTVRTLNEFMEWAAQFNDGQYLFRGVKKSTYGIVASASHRLPQEYQNNPSRLLKINKRLIEDARGRGHDQKDGRILLDLELLAELQHFGAATCLIDFTRSALVALWFACECGTDDENDSKGKVVAVRRDIRLRTVTSDLIQNPIDHFFQVDEKDQYRLYQWEPKLQNNRIIAQHSVFVFGGAEVKIETDCEIVTDCKSSILKPLNKVSDITETSIYPDFDGFARVHAYNRPYTEPDVQSHLQRGIEAHQRGELNSATEYYTHIISLDPVDNSIIVNAYYNRGLVSTQKGSYDDAIADFGEAIKRNRNFADAHYHRGWVYGEKRDYDRAINDLTKAIELRPDYAYAYYSRGWNYGQKNDCDRAINDYTKAIQLKPDYADAYHNRGWAHGKKNYHIPAIMDYGMAIQLRPTFSDSYFNRGLEWLHLANWDNARFDLTAARNMGVDIAERFCNLYGNVNNFQQITNVPLPPDIAAMLTPSQDEQ